MKIENKKWKIRSPFFLSRLHRPSNVNFAMKNHEPEGSIWMLLHECARQARWQGTTNKSAAVLPRPSLDLGKRSSFVGRSFARSAFNNPFIDLRIAVAHAVLPTPVVSALASIR